MYKIIGADGREYGPASADQLRQWIAQGLANSQTRTQAEGNSEWKTLSQFPEFAYLFASPPPAAAAMAPMQSAVAPKTSGLAITSLALGIVGFLTCGLTSLVGLILGIVARGKIKASGGRVRGGGLAVAGICVSSISSFMLFFLPVFILPALLLPAIQGAQGRAQQASCMSNLQQIGLACLLFANDHKGAFPADLNELSPQYLTTPRVFHCPSDRNASNASYVYVAGLTENDANKILIYDKPNNHRNGRVVVYGDGHVAWMSEAAFQNEIRAQEDDLKKGKRESNSQGSVSQ